VLLIINLAGLNGRDKACLVSTNVESMVTQVKDAIGELFTHFRIAAAVDSCG
jgi:hypothetical protein